MSSQTFAQWGISKSLRSCRRRRRSWRNSLHSTTLMAFSHVRKIYIWEKRILTWLSATMKVTRYLWKSASEYRGTDAHSPKFVQLVDEAPEMCGRSKSRDPPSANTSWRSLSEYPQANVFLTLFNQIYHLLDSTSLTYSCKWYRSIWPRSAVVPVLGWYTNTQSCLLGCFFAHPTGSKSWTSL